MIKSFRNEATEQIFRREFVRSIPHDIQRIILRKLLMIDAAVVLDDLRVPPANHLERLHGNRDSQYSIRVNKQWRVCFEWRDGNAYHVEITDYH